MLSPEYMRNAPLPYIEMLQKIEDDTITDIVKYYKKHGTVPQYKIDTLTNFPVDEVIDKLNKLSTDITDDVFKKAAYETIRDDMERYLTSIDYSPALEAITTAVELQTNGEFANMTQSLGIGPRGIPINEYVDQNFMAMSIGQTDITSTVKKVIREISADGLVFIDYATGYRRSVEATVRSTIVTGTSQLAKEMGLRNALDLDQDLMELSAHAGARASHAEWQGKIVSLSGRDGYLSLDDIGYGTVTGFGGANCRHSWFPYFEGSKRMYTNKELRSIKGQTVKVGDKTVPLHVAISKQRAMERNIRKTKRMIVGFEAFEDELELLKLNSKLKLQMKQYKTYSTSIGQIIDRLRLYI